MKAKLMRSSSLRNSIANFTSNTSDHHQPSLAPSNQYPFPSPTTSINSSNSNHYPLTPNQVAFPSTSSEISNHHPQLHNPPQIDLQTCSYPTESKSIPSRSLHRFRHRLSNSGFVNHSPKLSRPPIYSHHNTSILSESQNLVPPPVFEPSRSLHNSNGINHKRVRSTTLANPKLPDVVPKPPENSLSKSCYQKCPVKSQNSQLLFGFVTQTYKAEIPEELSARAGESVTINAYDDGGWFVCKPISRLGGPGLIPVTHVRVCDIATGKELSNQDLPQLARSYGLPQLGEWQQAAAAYKYKSITLGSLESPSFPVVSNSARIDVTPELPEPPTDLDTTEEYASQDDISSELVCEWQLQQVAEESHDDVSRPSTKSSYTSVDQFIARHGTFTGASVQSSHEEEGQLLFLIKVKFAYRADSERWMKTCTIHRSYKEFLTFDRSFRSRLETLSDESVAQPKLPILMDQIPARLIAQRAYFTQLEDLIKCYLSELTLASLPIRQSRELHDFLAPSEAHLDFETQTTITPDAMEEEVMQYLGEMVLASSLEDGSNSRQSMHSRARSSYSCRQNSSPIASPSHGHRSSDPISEYSSNNLSSDYFFPKKNHASLRRLEYIHTKSYYQWDGEFTKIKVYDLQSDDVIALKVPSRTGLEELSAKIAGRFCGPSTSTNPDEGVTSQRKIVLRYLMTDASDDSNTNFIDCNGSGDELEFGMSRSQAKMTKFTSDEELWNWMLTEDRLVIFI